MSTFAFKIFIIHISKYKSSRNVSLKDCLIKFLVILRFVNSPARPCHLHEIIGKQGASKSHILPHSATFCHILIFSTFQYSTVKLLIPKCHILPHSATFCHILPQSATFCHILPHSATFCHILPHSNFFQQFSTLL